MEMSWHTAAAARWRNIERFDLTLLAAGLQSSQTRYIVEQVMQTRHVAHQYAHEIDACASRSPPWVRPTGP